MNVLFSRTPWYTGNTRMKRCMRGREKSKNRGGNGKNSYADFLNNRDRELRKSQFND